MDILSKRLKEKSLMYSHDEFKDITDIVKVLFKVGYCYTTCTLMFTCLPIFLNLLVAWTGLSNLLDPKGNAVCSFTLILTNFWDTVFRVEWGCLSQQNFFLSRFLWVDMNYLQAKLANFWIWIFVGWHL